MDIPIEERKKQITNQVEMYFAGGAPPSRTASPPVCCLIGFGFLFFIDAIARRGASCPKDEVWV